MSGNRREDGGDLSDSDSSWSDSSVASGGASWELVASGARKDYCFHLFPVAEPIRIRPDETANPEILDRNIPYVQVPIERDWFPYVVGNLAGHIKSRVIEIEMRSGRTATRVQIGRAQVKMRKNRSFDIGDPTTWSVGSSGKVGNRWSSKYKKQGFDGLVVIAAFGRSHIPYYLTKKNMTQQDVAIAVERMLHLHFVYVDTTIPFEHTPGDGPTHTVNVASVIYFAFALSPAAEPKSRPHLVRHFGAVARRIKSLQLSDRTWSVRDLDDEQPEKESEDPVPAADPPPVPKAKSKKDVGV